MTVGIDAILTLTNDNVYDISIGDNGDIESADSFDTAILTSIFAERRANESEVLQAFMRRGWIGNESTPGFEIGSKIWLYEQARMTRTVLNGITTSATQSLQWLIDSGYALSVKVETNLTTTGVRLDIVIYRPNSEVEHRYYTLWDNTGIPVTAKQTFFQLTASPAVAATSINSFVIFDKIGRPDYPVEVIVYSFKDFAGVAAPTISTGIGWHPDSVITIYNDANVKLIGAGGRGGRGGETSGNGGVGGGGTGGNSFGPGGLPNGYDGLWVATPSGPATGSATGGTVDRAAENGETGYPSLEMFHDVTLSNYGTLSGGCGGGGGGGADGGDGGVGGVHGFQYAANAGDPGTGTDPGVGGSWGYTIVKNGYTLTYAPQGIIRGPILP